MNNNRREIEQKLTDFISSTVGELMILDEKTTSSIDFKTSNSFNIFVNILESAKELNPNSINKFIKFEILKRNKNLDEIRTELRFLNNFDKRLNYFSTLYVIYEFNSVLGAISSQEISEIIVKPKSTVSTILTEFKNTGLINQPLSIDPHVLHRRDLLKFIHGKGYSEFYQPKYENWNLIELFEPFFFEIKDRIRQYYEYWRRHKIKFQEHQEKKEYSTATQSQKFLLIFEELRDKKFYPKQLQDILVYKYCVVSNQRWVGEMFKTSEEAETPTKMTGWREFWIKQGYLETITDSYGNPMFLITQPGNKEEKNNAAKEADTFFENLEVGR